MKRMIRLQVSDFKGQKKVKNPFQKLENKKAQREKT